MLPAGGIGGGVCGVEGPRGPEVGAMSGSTIARAIVRRIHRPLSPTRGWPAGWRVQPPYDRGIGGIRNRGAMSVPHSGQIGLLRFLRE